LLCGNYLVSQNATVSGYVTDAKSGERLIGVNVYANGTTYGTVTNTFGFYTLPLPPGNYALTASFIGYQIVVDSVKLAAGKTTKDFALSPRTETLEEATIIAQERQTERVQMSKIELSAAEIKNIPMLMGEVDVIRAIQLLPGVQSGNEGTTGFYVRGGSPDQNLILLDGVPVYNASHLFGFFSVFNADAIKNVNLTKGGFPARFGGRLSSVLEIDLKEGNMKEFHGEGSLGLISSKFTLEGPLVKDQTSFMLSGRRTYYDLLVRPFLPADEKFGYYFADFNGKINHIFSRKDRLYASYYTGIDDFFARQTFRSNGGPFGGGIEEESNEQGIYWGNHTASLRWNHLFNNSLFSNLTATFTQYSFNVGFEEENTFQGETNSFGFEYQSLIRDYGLRYDLEQSLNSRHKLRYGASYTYHIFKPGVAQVQEQFASTNIDSILNLSNPIYAHDAYLYAEDEWRVNSKLKVNYGLHYAMYGAGSAFYNSLQPRVSARYLVNSNWSLKGSYAYMNQFIHLLSNTGIGLPTDLWVSSTQAVRPQTSEQVAIGSSHSFLNNQLEFTLESYYKRMQNLIEYKEGASFISTTDWQNNVETNGRGEAYGFEFLLRKKRGKTTGWIGYTLAWTNRQFSNLNNGNWFPYRYDRRHDVSVVLSHQFSKRFDMGLTWVYGSGNTFTAPVADIFLGGSDDFNGFGFNNFQVYTDRNGLRMPAYHRMDVGFNFHKKTRWGQRTWNISFYNTYNRRNPFFLYLSQDFNGNNEVRQVSLFPIIPSISYVFKF
jgi:outer membrane receptor for ferrienterochelin and colicin